MRSCSALLLSIVATLGATAPTRAQERDWDALDARITEATFAAPIRFLADDLLEGRGVGTRGDALSRLYLATQLELFGCEPGGPDGSWEQPVPILGIRAKVTTPMTVHGPGGAQRVFEAPADYTCEAGRPLERTGWDGAPVVFVGYGIDAPEQSWDDYGDADLKGKVLLVMNNDPDWDPKLFEGKRRLYYGRWSYKYEEAARRGAAGAIVIHTTPSAGYPFQVIQAGQGQEQFWLPFEPDVPTLALQSWCSEDAARAICALGGHDLDQLREAARHREFEPVDLGVTIDLSTENTIRQFESANVLGVVPGADPAVKDEAIVVTAHFDHLGRGAPKRGDDIYNGALDNASGCSLALNLARVCAHLDRAPRRSLLFLLVTGEESGLLGSNYYAHHPTFPREKLIADFNFDIVNIWGRTEDVQMIGYGKSTLTALAQRVAERRGRRVEPNDRVDRGMFYRSDHFSFARIGVPSAYFKAGSDFVERRSAKRRVKASYTATRYHQPNDEFDDRWDLSGAVEDTRLILECLLRAADADEPPHWAPGDEFEKLR